MGEGTTVAPLPILGMHLPKLRLLAKGADLPTHCDTMR